MDYTDPSVAFVDGLPPAAAVGLPGEDLGQDEIVLGIGLPQAAAAALIRAGQRAGVAAVVLDGPDPALTELAAELATPLYWRPAELSWRQLHQQLSNRLSPRPVRGDDELADLAQTIATLTGGLVTIEDTASRVLAYSSSSDEVDELRRLSILGRSGPPGYLKLLREWGVYDRLAASEEVVEIAEHPASGVRRRLAVGVFAGRRQLGTIWLQQGSADFGPHARQALLGAARLTAVQLASQGNRTSRPGGAGLAELLTGRSQLAGLGRDAGKPCAVAVFVLGSTGDDDPAAVTVRLDELLAIVTVHGAALRRHAVAEIIDGRVYLLLPNLAASEIAHPMLADAIAAVRQHLDPSARAGLGDRVDSVAAAARSRRTAELALTVDSVAPVLSFTAARAGLIVRAAEISLLEQPELPDVRYAELFAADRASAETLLRYLDHGSDIRRVAEQLGVHQTTVRYRLRRAIATLDLDLAEPDERLAAQLQLRCGLRVSANAG